MQKETVTTPEQIAKELAQSLANFLFAHQHCLDKTYDPEMKIFGLHFDFSLIDGAARDAKEVMKHYREYRDETGNF